MAIITPIVLEGALVVAICSVITRRLGGVTSVLLGILVGASCPIAVGVFMFYYIPIGFEAATGIIPFSVKLAIPGAIGGGIVGYFLARAKARDAVPAVSSIK